MPERPGGPRRAGEGRHLDDRLAGDPGERLTARGEDPDPGRGNASTRSATRATPSMRCSASAEQPSSVILRAMPPDQRERVLESDRFKGTFSDQERNMLRETTKLPLAPAQTDVPRPPQANVPRPPQ